MSYLIIRGGKKLSGSVVTQSAKNSALALLCAAVMVRDRVRLVDVPEIEEINRMVELLQSIGVIIERPKPHVIEIDARGELMAAAMNRTVACQMRSSLLLLGALASREGKYRLYKSGGCKLGKRTVRPHVFALEKLGVSVISREGYYDVTNSALHGANIVMYESGDTPTENAIMAAVLAPGVTTIKMASSNYMVQDLCFFLVAAGAKIKGIGTTTLTITGVKKLHGVKNYPVMPDPIVAMTLLAVGITTHSGITVKNCPIDFLDLELTKLEMMGQKLQLVNVRRSANRQFHIADIELTPSTLVALPDKIYGRPFPGLNIDNLPLFVPILTQAKGRTLVHDWVFENRVAYFLELQKMGAKLSLLDIHRLVVEGKTKLMSAEIVAPPALRPAVGILIAMLAATGESVLHNTYEIDRGYENFYDTLKQLGANITVVKS